jgi:cytochrome bd-type quinol oxidase subunit 2
MKTLNKFCFFLLSLLPLQKVMAVDDSQVQVNEGDLGFKIPNLGEILTFVIRFFFVLAGLAALLYLLLGALSWITSGGNKENVEKARDKIQAAIVGMIVIVLVVALIWTLEQVVFKETLCFGISCPITIPSLLKPAP